jgi:hypothetical protein
VYQELHVDFVQFVDEYQPGIVEREFIDADRDRHTLIDKIPLFTTVDLRPDSYYSQAGGVRCRILGRSGNSAGRELLQNHNRGTRRTGNCGEAASICCFRVAML